MSLSHGSSIVTDGLVFYYDQNNTQKSWKGAPTTNLIYSIPLPFNVYAYATGPIQTNNVSDELFKLRTVNRYTISQVVNTSRASLNYYSLSVGASYAFSFKWKYNGTNTVTPNINVNASKEIPEGTYNTFSSSLVTTTPLSNGWYYTKYEFTVATSTTNACKLTYGIDTGTDTNYLNNTFDIYEEQFEVSVIATPFINGTRSNTQAVLDLTNNNTITANSLTYASDGSFSFNGSNNIITVSDNDNFSFTNQMFTFDYLVKFNNTTSYNGILGKGEGSWEYAIYANGTNGLVFYTWSISGAVAIYTPHTTTFIANQWYHHCWTANGTNSYLYINGVLTSTSNKGTSNLGNGSSRFTLGAGGDSGGLKYLNGNLSNVKIYNRALSAAEVSQNFNATRSRYDI